MADNMDRSLDEILAEKVRPRAPSCEFGANSMPYRRATALATATTATTAVEVLLEDGNVSAKNTLVMALERDSSSAKIRVENIHYELTEEDVEELFNRIGPVAKLDLKYDRAGRSEGIAFVTMQNREDALEAVKQFDGANANGQPIRLSIMPGGPGSRSRNPFDSAVMPGRPLSERISAPGGRSRSLSPGRKYDVDEAASKGIDRYVPGTRSRSPMPRRRGGGGGRRPGARREGTRDQQDGGRGGRTGRDGRARKTQEELDAEMADYFGGNSGETAPQQNGGADAAAPIAAANDDVDMIE
ncbi:THO complex subunit 4B [Colletotrichum chlorophyti]|uniref:THO complex subunit 4B n=1 Tax=Colletotrichum chlorophyti TaxID=708187 RepID=A0A1Q8RWC3_9PEZI|nr:THO complex subunit 4B [Colletotrichum chlorophyti]